MVFLIHTELRCTINHTSELLELIVFHDRGNNIREKSVNVRVWLKKQGDVSKSRRNYLVRLKQTAF